MGAARKLDWLGGGGEMAQLVSAFDWAASPLGPIERWPQSLRTTVSLCLASNFPINIIWGDQHTQIYNDGYRIACGAAHPRAMGADYRVTWASAWPAVGKPFERALAGETSYLENQRMFLERNGYYEETFFTFSLSPIRDEEGNVVGLFHPVTETTATILAERRTRALRDIADRAGSATRLEDACDLVLTTLEQSVLDLPFALLYLVSPDGTCGVLRGERGTTEPAGPLAAPTIALAEDCTNAWPLTAAARSGRSHRVDDMGSRFGANAAAIYPEPIATSFVLPLRASGAASEPVAYLIVGVSPRLPIDKSYEGFIEMVGAAANAAMANARAYEAEKQRAEALAALDRAKTTFFSNVSHEFRTPLTLLLGPVEDLLGGRYGALDDAVRHELDIVRRNSLRLLKLVNALLDFSRVESGGAAASFRRTDLSAFTRAVASMFVSAVERADLGYVIEIDSLPRTVLVDREMWEKILLNLVSNAFKFTHTGHIRVGLRAIGDVVELSVADTGIGIAPADLSHVFERFHRVQGARGRSHEGSGIGLALVNDLAKLHGGSAAVVSEIGKGSTFSVRIPLADAERIEDTSPTSDREPLVRSVRSEAFVEEAARWLPEQDLGDPPARGAEESSERGERERILLVDDNSDMRDYVRGLLARKYAVIAVGNGSEALEEARRSRPSLIVSDLMMPVMDGAELVAALRADETLRTIPVILLSARAGEDATATGLELGADDYLTKPFSARELLARVRSQLSMVALRDHAAEQKALVDNFMQQQRWLEEVLDRLPVATTVLDAARGRFTFANQAARRLAGGAFPDDEDAAERSESFALTDAADVPIARDSTPAARARRGEEVGGMEAVWHTQAGRFDVLVDSGLVPAVGAHPPRTIITFQDVSHLKAVERELKALLDARDEFLAIASHELKTPITSLSMQLQLAERSIAAAAADASPTPSMADALTKKLRAASRQVDRLAGLVDDLLDVARIRSSSLRLARQPMDLVALVRDALERLAPAIARAQSAIHLDVPTSAFGTWDARRLDQVFTNVVTNALRYAPGKPIEVRILDRDGDVSLAVRDFGPGVAADLRGAIFDRFDRGRASRNAGGLGLGLFISKQIVVAHGGTMLVDGPEGGGASFVVRLPRRAEPVAEVAE